MRARSLGLLLTVDLMANADTQTITKAAMRIPVAMMRVPLNICLSCFMKPICRGVGGDLGSSVMLRKGQVGAAALTRNPVPTSEMTMPKE